MLRHKILGIISLILICSFVFSACTINDSNDLEDIVESEEMVEVDDSIWENFEGNEAEDRAQLEDNIESDEDLGDELEDEDEVEVEESEETEESEQTIDAEETSLADHIINFVNEGFDPEELTITVGDTIEFVNVRDGNYKLAMLVGAQGHTEIKSGVLKVGESYSYTFNEADNYIFVDGILTTYTLKIIVE
jgi:plastocyanin